MPITIQIQRLSGITGVIVLWTSIPYAMHLAGLGLIDMRPISSLGVIPQSHWLSFMDYDFNCFGALGSSK